MPGTPLYIVAEDHQIEEITIDLIHIGLDEVAGYITPAMMQEYAASGGELRSTNFRPITDLMKCPTNEAFMVLDVRRPDEYAEGHLAGTKNIAHTRLLNHLEEIPRSMPIWVYCRSGSRSKYAVAMLESHGYKAVQLEGGYKAWQEVEGITVKDTAENFA